MQRSQLSNRERLNRSRLAQIIHAARFLRGTLALRNIRLRQLFVPRQWEERVREAVKNHQEMERLIEELSDLEWKRLKERKE